MNQPTIEPEYLSLPETARRTSIPYKTLIASVESGRLGKRQGITKVLGRWRVNWRTFQQTVMDVGRF